MAGNPVTPIPSVRVLWRPEQFTRVSNGTFETNTTGWLATAGINAAGTSITRITTDFHSGAACASVVCTATDTSGVNFDLGSDRYYSEASYGSIYVATGWVKRVSGSKRLRVTLGSLGTSSDRATLTITDLVDAWQPFVIRWLPTANRTDAELAVTNGSAEALTFRLDDVAVYAVDAFSQCENGTFETDTTGWTGYLSGSIARNTGTSFGGSAHGRVTSSTTANSGAYFGLGKRTFLSGRTYRLRFAQKTISGSGTWYAEFYDDTGASSVANVVFTPGADWAWTTLDWTPGSDYTQMEVGFYHVAASAAVMAIDEVEVYEAVDDLGTDAGDLRWSRSLDGIGTINVKVEDADGKYHPRNTSATLYGSLAPGKRIWGRATYSNALYPLFFGTLTTIEPPALGGIHTDLNAEDVMGDLSRAQHACPFLPPDGWTYASARKLVMDSVMTGQPRRLTGSINTGSPLGTSRANLTTTGIEAGSLYYGTDDIVTAADALRDINEATQTVHYAKPSVHANIGWRYTTVDRATLTDTSLDFTVDEDFEDFEGVRFSHEGMETEQIVPWQAYEKLPEPYAGYLVQALDRSVYAGSADLTDDDPYLHFLRDEYGESLDVPEPSYKSIRRWRRRKKGRRIVTSRRRIYPDAFVPFSLVAGETRRIAVDFAMGVTDVSWGAGIVAGPSAAPILTVIEETPTRAVIDLTAQEACTVTDVYITGIPYTVLDEQEAQNTSGTQAFPGPGFSTPYVPSRGMAEGIAAYRNWRYGTAPMRPTLVDHDTFPRSLTAEVTDHFTVSADRWRVDALLFVSTGCRWEVTGGGLDWRSWHALEELPTHTTWFTLDDATKGLDDAVVLAY